MHVLGEQCALLMHHLVLTDLGLVMQKHALSSEQALHSKGTHEALSFVIDATANVFLRTGSKYGEKGHVMPNV